VEDLTVPPADRRKMMFDNAAKLFRIPIPAEGGGFFGRL
jgi:hypothetical protein